MCRRLLQLNALRAFEVAARHRSLAKAAEELAVTPAAIHHQVKSLEENLGVSLFTRSGNNLALTQAAAEMKTLDVGLLPICDGDKLTGTLTDRDITVRGIADRYNPSDRKETDHVNRYCLLL